MIRERLHNLSVKGKLIAIAMLTTFLALFVNFIATALFDFWLFHYSLRQNISIHARIIADSSTAPISFNNRAEAESLLQTLKRNPAVINAAIYDGEDRIFASFALNNAQRFPPLLQQIEKETGFPHKLIHVHEPIILDNSRIGTVCLQSDLSVFFFWLRWFFLISVAIVGISLLTATFLSHRLQKMISIPLQQLSNTMEKVSQKGDYSLRLEKPGNDEVGLLATCFNDMLGRIEGQDRILKESEEKYRHFFENAGMGIFRIRSDGSAFLAANQKCSEMTGWPLEKLMEISPITLWGGEKAYQQTMELLSLKITVSNYEKKIVNKDETTRTLLFSLQLYPSEKVIEGSVVDITVQKELQQQLDDERANLAHTGRLTAMGEMATGIAHEINQPLTIISLATQYLKARLKKAGDSKLDEALLKINAQVKRASTIITNMRSFARTNKDKLRLISLKGPVEQALSFFHEQFRLRQINLSATVEKDLPMVKADAQKVEQIVVNFLSNARYAVEKKGKESDGKYQKEVSVRLLSDQKQQAVLLEVQDNGSGMSQETRNRCLDPFFTTKKPGEGTGLGLVIVHNLIQEFNGTLEVESSKGQGSCFRVLLPVEKEQSKDRIKCYDK